MPLDLPLIVPAIRLDRDDGREEERARVRALQPWTAGFLLFGGEAQQVARLTARLREIAGRPLFVASDMERGAGQQVRGLTRLPDLGLLGLAGTADDAHDFGARTAREARSVGVDVVFAPCLDVRSEVDNPILGNRSLGFDPWRVARLGAAFCRGVLAGGALPVAKHFPGHGATREDSHDALPVVHADLATLEQRDLPPFARAFGAGRCPAVMTAHVAYPALDPGGGIATFSRSIVERARALAGAAGEDLLVVTDALLMAGAAVEGGEAEAARRSLAAGCDVLLYPDDPEALAAALGTGAAERRAAARVAAFAARAERVAGEAGPPGSGEATAPGRVAARALELALDPQPHPVPDLLVLVDDDGIEERGDVLRRAARPLGLRVLALRVAREEPSALPPVPPGCTDAAVVVFASARAWKGASGVSAPGRRLVRAVQDALRGAGAGLRTIWLTPRPEVAGEEHVPGTGAHVEHALARRLLHLPQP